MSRHPEARTPILNMYEIETLRVAAGQNVPGFTWGACVSECLSTLKANGLVTPGPSYRATAKGKQYLIELDYPTAQGGE